MAQEYSDPDLNTESCLALGTQSKARLLSRQDFNMKVAEPISLVKLFSLCMIKFTG